MVGVLAVSPTRDSHADIDIGNSSGDVQQATLANVTAGQSENNDFARVFKERESITLTSPEPVNVFLPAGTDSPPCVVWKIPNPALDRDGHTDPGVIPAGWDVDSHLIHADRVSDSTSEPWNYYDGTVAFVDRIIGVIFNESDLDDGDDQLGRAATTYPNAAPNTLRDIENNDAGANGNIDYVTINCGGSRRVTFHLEVAEAMDQIRVVTVNYADFVVRKNFSPDSSAAVTVSVQCTGSTVTPSSATATESNPAEFRVADFDLNPTPNCTASESPIPGGYSSSGQCSANLLTGECTITNTRRSGTVTLDKDFSNASTATVYAELSCTEASPPTGIQTITPSGRQTVTHTTNRVWTVRGFGSSTVCNVTEYPNAFDPAGPPPGYRATGLPAGPSDHQCTAPALAHLGAVSCKITNTLRTGTVTLDKDFSNASTATVYATLSCTDSIPPTGVQTITPAGRQTVTHTTNRTWIVSGFGTSADPTTVCTATEYPSATLPEGPPSGYSASGTPPGTISSKTWTCNAPTLTHMGGESCKITNTVIPPLHSV